MGGVNDYRVNDLTPPGENRAGVLVKNLRLCGSGVYEYHRSEIGGLIDGAIPEAYAEVRWFGVYRPPEVLQARRELFARKYITVEHPPEFVDINNAKQYSHGLTGDGVDYEEGEDGETYLYTSGTFMDADAVDYYNHSKELSCGYVPKVVWEQGEHKGKAYQLKMEDIADVNHVALVERGRGGRLVKVLDSKNKLLEAIRRKQKMLPFELIMKACGVKDDAGKVKRAFDSVRTGEHAGQVQEFMKPYLDKIKACDGKTQLEGYLRDFVGLQEADKETFVACRDHVRDLAVGLLKDSATEPAKAKDDPKGEDDPKRADEPEDVEDPNNPKGVNGTNDMEQKIERAVDALYVKVERLLDERLGKRGATDGEANMPLGAQALDKGTMFTSEGLFKQLQGGE